MTENQGYGAYVCLKPVVEEYLRQEGKTLSKENFDWAMQRFAKENKKSYTPNPILGQNPEPRITKSLKPSISPEIFSGNSILKKRYPSSRDVKMAQIELGGAVTSLTEMILKHNIGLKTTRKGGADVSDPRQITSFEYIGTGPGNTMAKEERNNYNAFVTMNRYSRIMIESYLYSAVEPLLRLNLKSFYKALYESGFGDIPINDLRKTSNIKFFVMSLRKRFSVVFDSLDLNEMFSMFKIRKKKKT